MRLPQSLVALAVAAAVLSACAGDSATSGTATSVPPAPRAAATSSPPSAAALPRCPDQPRVPPRADGLPPVTLPCLGRGPDVRLSDLRGTPTVINVWAAWCTNCDREMPLFTRLQNEAGPQVRVFGVHYKAPRDFALRSAADFGVTFPSGHDEDGDKTAAALGAPGPPTTLFVTADGRVAGRRIGEIASFAELARLVRQYLAVTM